MVCKGRCTVRRDTARITETAADANTRQGDGEMWTKHLYGSKPTPCLYEQITRVAPNQHGDGQLVPSAFVLGTEQTMWNRSN